MCIIIDTSALSSVFNRTSKVHLEFSPVFDWIIRGKGKVVYGGTKYKRELAQARRYAKLFAELRRAGRTALVDDQKVDQEQRILEETSLPQDFDDPHLVAIVIVSHCKLICSNDSTAYLFFKDKTLYPEGVERPKIYSGYSNKSLLVDENIADICKPCPKTPSRLQEGYLSALPHRQ